MSDADPSLRGACQIIRGVLRIDTYTYEVLPGDPVNEWGQYCA